MASMDAYEVNVCKAASELHIKVTLRGLHVYRIRKWASVLLFKLAGWVCPATVEICDVD